MVELVHKEPQILEQEVEVVLVLLEEMEQPQ